MTTIAQADARQALEGAGHEAAISVVQAAVMAGVSRSTLYLLAKAGRIPLRKVGARTVVLPSDVRRLRGEM